jgi:type II secretory pathway pseudopilin PulG
MGLRGQDGERGYAMAALLVALAIMAILMTIAMPVWRHEARREKEAELVFRGEQYARAIALFRHKNQNNPNAWPPSIDFLVQNRFLRKKFKDPMTADGEFVPLSFGSQTPGIPPTTPPPPVGRGRGVQPGQQPVGVGMQGVRSKSTETSIRAYRGATRYDQWLFTFSNVPRPGGAMAGPGGRGGDPNNPGRGGRGGPGGFGTEGRGGRGGAGGSGARGGRGSGVGRGAQPQIPPGGPRGAGPGGRGGF